MPFCSRLPHLFKECREVIDDVLGMGDCQIVFCALEGDELGFGDESLNAFSVAIRYDAVVCSLLEMSSCQRGGVKKTDPDDEGAPAALACLPAELCKHRSKVADGAVTDGGGDGGVVPWQVSALYADEF